MYSNNFGVIEVASTRTTSAPGWAYVRDTTVGNAALQPSNRKRARNHGPAPTGADLNARQEAKLRKELEALDRDGNRDANIPVPPKTGATRASTKSTPNVRKIFQSQKTFANHLDDYNAFQSHSENNPAPHPNQHTPHHKNPPSHPNQHAKSKPPHPNQYTKKPPQPNQYTKRNAAAESGSSSPHPSSLKKGEASKSTTTSRSKSWSRRSLRNDPEPTPESPTPETQDVDMTDAPGGNVDDKDEKATSIEQHPSCPPILTPYERLSQQGHSSDDDPLLQSVVPELPDDDELRGLLARPPLSYAQARAEWGAGDRRYPVRRFCQVCGYWGRVRCMKCGTRVCALDCLDVHREECVTRYGF